MRRLLTRRRVGIDPARKQWKWQAFFRVDKTWFRDKLIPTMKRLLVALALCAIAAWPSQAIEFTATQSGRISFAVSKLLERYHYRQSTVDDALSEKFLRTYLNTLDYNHLIFLQTDVEEFEKLYNQKLDDALRAGTSEPAFAIFDRYLQRLAEGRRQVDKALQDKFDFTQEEKFLPARNKAPWPQDKKEAEALWTARVKYELLQGKLNKEKPEETVRLIGKRYARLEKTMREYDAEEILQSYLTALSHTFDPHSDYLSPTEAANFEIQNISLKLSGIGAQLEWDDGNTKIRSLVPGGPAELSKLLKPNDKIVAVGQEKGEMVDVVEMRLNKVVQMIRGERTTKVRLTVIPASAPDTKKDIVLVRDEIKLKDQHAKAQVIEHIDGLGKMHRLGLVNLPQFYDNCSDDVAKLLERLKKEKVEGVILDLRRNGGGILEESIKLTGLFIKEGPIVQVKDHKDTRVMKDGDPNIAYDGPLVVLQGKLSASASEITSAALQDYGRALLVGDLTTHGKGTVQQVLSLDRALEDIPNPGKLKLTVSKFYRIAGGTTQKEGVTPEIVLPSIYDYLDIGESSLENCLPAGGTMPVSYTRLDLVQKYVPELAKRSKVRVDASKDFGYLREDIVEVKKRQDDKSVSLNEAKRVAEKKLVKDQADARKKERAGRKPSMNRSFDLTLENIEKNEPMKLVVAVKKEKVTESGVVVEEASVEPEPDADESSPFDPQLDETVAILSDYIGMLKIAVSGGTVVQKK